MQTKSLSSRIIATALSVLLVIGFLPITQYSAYAEPTQQSEAAQSTGSQDEGTSDDNASSGSNGAAGSEEPSEGDSSSADSDAATGGVSAGDDSGDLDGSAGSSDANDAESGAESGSVEGNDASLASEGEEDTPSVAGEDEAREAATFNANSYVKSVKLSLTSGTTTKTYDITGTEPIDTRADFEGGLSRSANYTANIVIDTKAALEADGSYPFVAGDKLICRVPNLIKVGQGTTSGRLHDSTADWDSANNGVGDFEIIQDAEGNNFLTLTYDDGYVTEKSGKILAATVKISGSFDTSKQTTESFDADLVFGNSTAVVTFSKLEIVRNLSIEKTSDLINSGPYVSSSSPSRPRDKSASLDSEGYLTYCVTVSAGSDNTYKLTNVKVTDLFDTASKAKVDLGTMKLVSVSKDGKVTTSQAEALRDASGNINGWNIGDLEIGSSAVVTFKVKLNKDGVALAVKAAKEADSTTDAMAARSIKNTATASADDTNPVSADCSTYVSNYLSTSKTTSTYDWATQTQNFTVTITSPADNRYTMYNVPIYDYLESPLDAKYYKESGIKSITVTHTDGKSETLAWDNFNQILTSAWSATISEIRPGDIVTVNTYLTFSDEYWKRSANVGQVGDSSQKYNCVQVGNVGSPASSYPDLNRSSSVSSFKVVKNVLVKNSPNINSDGTIDWVISGNERAKSATPTDVGGLVLTDKLGPNQEFGDSVATVVFYKQDGSVAARDSIQLTAGSTSFTYTIPAEYGTYAYTISYKSVITDWETYVGPAKSYTNTVNGWTSSTSQRARVASMDKSFVEQADDWSKWKTSIYSELDAGDTYVDTSRNGINTMYFTQEDLDGITLTIDGIAVDKSLYEIVLSGNGSNGKYSSYKITFKGSISVEKDGATVKPSASTPLVISYQAHMVNPTPFSTRTYYNDAKLTAGNVSDSDYDYCKRRVNNEIAKSVIRNSRGTIVWEITANSYGYSGQPDGTCVITDTLPAGVSYVNAYVSSPTYSRNGNIDSVDSTVNEDGTTTLTIKLSGLKHDEVCKAHPSDNNYYYQFRFRIETKVTDPEYLYGGTSKDFTYENTASLTDRYGNKKTASRTAEMQHIAMKKTMEYNEVTAPYAQFSILANQEKLDLNPDGDTVGIVDVSSKTLSIDTKSIAVVDMATGLSVPFTVDTSKMAENKLTISVPDNKYVKITYQAQVIGVTGKDVEVGNSAYYDAYKSTSEENTIKKTVTILSAAGESTSEPMVYLSKKDESAAALGGATYRLESYDQVAKVWKTLRTGITSISDSSKKGLKVESLELDTLYRLVETQAPEGYVLDETPHYFVLVRDSEPTVSYPDGVDSDDVLVGTPGSIINAYNAPYTKVRFVKNSADGVQLSGAEFAIYKVTDDGAVDSTPALDANGNKAVFTTSADAMNEISLAPGTYQLVETKAPAGYEKSGPVTFVVAGNADRTVTVNGTTVQSGKDDQVSGAISVTDETMTTSLKVTKAWDDCSDFEKLRPATAKVALYADYDDGNGLVAVCDENGAAVTAELNEDGDWTASFDDLSVMKEGKKISYTVKEIDSASGEVVESGATMSNGYTVSVSDTTGDVAGGVDNAYAVTVTNAYSPQTTSLNVTKTWDDADNQDGKRPGSVTVQLFANGKAVEGLKVELNETNGWTAGFDNLEACDSDGNVIVYTVKELDADNGNAPVEFGGETKSGYTVELVSASYAGYPDGAVPIEKVAASDSGNDGDDADAADANADAADATDGDTDAGNAASDGDAGVAPSGPESEEAGKDDAQAGRSISYAIKNVHEVEKTSVEVTKEWVGDDESMRPASIMVELLKNGEVADTATIEPDENGEWKHSFVELDKYEAGAEIEYAVREAEVPEGYTSEISGDKDSGFVIINTKIETPVTPDEADDSGEGGNSDEAEESSSPDQPYAKTGAQAPANNLGLILLVAAAIAGIGGVCVAFAIRRSSRKPASAISAAHSKGSERE